MKKILLLLAVALTVCGCRHLDPTGVYKGDAILYHSELAIPTAYQFLHSYVIWEKAQRPLLTKWPEITKAADFIRANAQRWIDSANALHDAYKLNPSDANKTALQTSLDLLQTAMLQANAYMLQATSK